MKRKKTKTELVKTILEETKIDNNVQVRLSKEQEAYYLKEKIKEIEKIA